MDEWILTASEPAGGHLYLANGYLGTALSWSGGVLFDSESDPCYVRGVYNDTGPGGIDRIARAPNWSQIRYGAQATHRDYRRDLDIRRGLLRTCFVLEEERGRVRIDQTILCSRADRHTAVVRMDIRADFDGEILLLAGLEGAPSEDIVTLELGAECRSTWLLSRIRKYRVEVATALTVLEERWQVEDNVGPTAATRQLRTHARAGEEITLTQVARVVTSLETDDPLDLALQKPASFERILHDHTAAWDRLWEVQVDIEGDPEAEQYVRAALYYLWSTVRERDRWSIAPMGLSSEGYNGHIFWDAELWMFPTLLVTQPDMARSCLNYREHTIEAARSRAREHGHRGARFPWEGGFTGEEMTPTWAEPRELQIHITADVALAHWWYYLNTGDLRWLRSRGFPTMRECAEFWASRVEWDPVHMRYDIKNVQCADEYAAGVDNNAFTNAAAQECLRVAALAAELIGETPPPAWRAIADQIHIPYDFEHQRHLVFEGYDGQVTKQADVELLVYPLEVVIDSDQVQRDIDFYSAVVDANGPAMSSSVHSIISAQLGRGQEAYDYFSRSYLPNTRLPFQSFSETPTNNQFHFCTGVGGSLQGPLFGFTGLRLRQGYFQLGPILPPHWEALRLRKLFIHGTRTDIEILSDALIVRRHLSDRGLVTRFCREGDAVYCEPTWETEGPSLDVEVKGDDDVWRRAAPTGGNSVPLPSALTKNIRLRVRAGDGSVPLDMALCVPPGGNRPFG